MSNGSKGCAYLNRLIWSIIGLRRLGAGPAKLLFLNLQAFSRSLPMNLQTKHSSRLPELILAYDDLEKNAPEGFESGPTDNPEDENVEMDPDEYLPWPDPALIQKRWANDQNRFQNGTR